MIKYRDTYEETEEAIIINCYNKIGNICVKQDKKNSPQPAKTDRRENIF